MDWGWGLGGGARAFALGPLPQKTTFRTGIMKTKKKILFVCLGNSCRSIMAEALTRHFYGETWEAASAGLSPLGWVAEKTLEVLEELGINTRELHSKGLNHLKLHEFQAIVNLTEYDMKMYVPENLRGRIIQKPVLDPYGRNMEAYRRSREEIILLLETLVI
ncbi:MAG: low molecular weight phosphatase family protein [Deltaproteobacteria bacterium]|nr:low molecular weight phosphatase family protein [Deltaproteobacteria bacterium]